MSHWFWLILIVFTFLWYLLVTILVTFRGAKDIRRMINGLEEEEKGT